ncbi:hypothetical protein GQ43DRAFT_134731 [Delitschia confertaspora ATCC 74209]|uniref:Uncharacterized protein n=1 Tax=Delitschia confertaspora ATCC 74209 TaxID=1513339 RepID=A0A9P4JH43_9PLEO|nr:hypothetical protein GQ43DRAFT_134731 [Delitschia confertaspora ATCC 74209]
MSFSESLMCNHPYKNFLSSTECFEPSCGLVRKRVAFIAPSPIPQQRIVHRTSPLLNRHNRSGNQKRKHSHNQFSWAPHFPRRTLLPVILTCLIFVPEARQTKSIRLQTIIKTLLNRRFFVAKVGDVAV